MNLKSTLPALTLLLLLCAPIAALAQDNKAKAEAKAREAIQMVDKGQTSKAIPLLEEAQKLDSKNMIYPYEIAYAYYTLKDYKQSVKILEGLLSHKDVSPLVYQLLGNGYDNLGNSKKAIATYEAGLKKFPNSGSLYLELGVMQLPQKEYNKALEYFEKGIEVDPAYPSNYYWASKIYLASTEEVWGMLYGEIFMNIERNSARTAEISKLLYDTYKKEIQISGDTSYAVSFSKNTTIYISEANPEAIKMPFGVGIYEPILSLSMLGEKTIDANSLDRIRQNFVQAYYNQGKHTAYPNALFDYQKAVKDAGHMEAYNHWVLMKGDEEAFNTWQAGHEKEWDAFIAWFKENPMRLSKSNRFYRMQY